jgi:hypothetical protein
LKLEIRYPDKPPHEVELRGPIAILGRDPACDLVLNDERCSRRHAVIEVTPSGLQVRDAGSANGVFVNGKKRERSPLIPGDLIRIGDVILKVLPEEMAGTVIVAPDDFVELAADGAPPPAAMGPTGLGTEAVPVLEPRRAKAARRDVGRSAPAGGAHAAPGLRSAAPAAHAGARPRPAPASGRPLTLTILGTLWVVSVFLYGALAFAASILRLQGTAAIVNVAISVLLALVSAVMAYGLFAGQRWARVAQAVIAGIGLLVCPFTLAAATTLIYVLRPSTKAAFGKTWPPADPAETTFALTLIGTVVLGVGLCAAGLLANRFLR